MTILVVAMTIRSNLKRQTVLMTLTNRMIMMTQMTQMTQMNQMIQIILIPRTMTEIILENAAVETRIRQ